MSPNDQHPPGSEPMNDDEERTLPSHGQARETGQDQDLDTEGVGLPAPAGNTGLGRPTVYTDAIGLHLCQELEAGRTISAICKEDTGMPVPRTVYRWVDEDSTYRLRVARARAAGGDALVDDALDRLDTSSVGPGGTIQREREVASHLRWMAARMAPAQWGDKVQVSAQVSVTQEVFDTPAWLGALVIEGEAVAVREVEEEVGEEAEENKEAQNVRVF